MITDSSQTRMFGKVGGQFLHARWWLKSPILDAHTLPHFGQAKVWAEDDRDAARTFRLLRCSFVVSCLSASNLRLAFLTDERIPSRSEACCCHDTALSRLCKLSLQLDFVTLSRSTTIAPSFC